MVLLLGPCYNRKDKSKTGGIVVLFENWLNYYNQIDEKYILIDTNKSNYKNTFVAYCVIVFRLFKYVSKCNILFLHGTAKDYLYLAPLVVLLGKIFKKKTILRKFAGDFKERYQSYNKVFKKIVSFVLHNASILFWETKALVQFGLNYNKSSYWFPNVRYKNVYSKNDSVYNQKFVFISQVRSEKGILELKSAFEMLDKSYQLDIYGPIIDIKESDLNGANYKYHRPLEPNEVCGILRNYDCLILPSYREGYPGIVIEAFSLGIPVIATNIGGIPEIVTDGYNGYLIKPYSDDEIVEAVLKINKDNNKFLSQNALESFKDFDASIVNERINKIINS